MYQDKGITLNPLKAFLLCIQKILKPENYLARVMGLRCERVYVLLAVKSGITSPNMIV